MKIIGRCTRRTSGASRIKRPGLFIVFACFLIGAFLGLFFMYLCDPGDGFRSHLEDYFVLASHGILNVSLGSVLWDCISWPFIASILGLTAAGVIAVPALFLLRGFLLTYTTVCLGALFGMDGVAVAAALFWVSAILVLPALFLIGGESLRAAYERRSGSPESNGAHFRPEIILPAIGSLVIAISLQWTVAPTLLTAVCARIFT